jgi:hypothetical protein
MPVEFNSGERIAQPLFQAAAHGLHMRSIFGQMLAYQFTSLSQPAISITFSVPRVCSFHVLHRG